MKAIKKIPITTISDISNSLHKAGVKVSQKRPYNQIKNINQNGNLRISTEMMLKFGVGG